MDLGTAIRQLEPALKAWGKFVVDAIVDRVELEIGAERAKAFFKVTPTYRPKDVNSALKKQAKKKYDDPLDKMSDLVGARFVVLLKTDMEIVERAVTTITAWSRSRDRSPQDERDDRPKFFDYQSLHYVVRNNQEHQRDGATIPVDLPCEIQIRTLLQHAYAELVHDKIYKSEKPVPQSAERLVARSMALMETTDEMFVAAVGELERVHQELDAWCSLLDASVGPILTAFTPTARDADAMELLSTFKHILDLANGDQVKALLINPVIARIQQKAPDGGLFSKPVVLAVYWLALNHPIETTAAWPIPALQGDLDLLKAYAGVA
jgi:putative GTP pyrophosphokinase